MPLVTGLILGPYKIVSSLGAGGMGEVYRALDTRLGREVALKVLPPDVVGDPGRLERFDREARAIAALNHPHIVTLYSTEEADGIRFLTMELVEGQTLTELIKAGPLSVERFLDIALQLADALAAAHQKNITHRDLKPGNVMVSGDSRVKVLDFGLARVGGQEAAEHSIAATQAPMTQVGTIVGTVPYMSPEQIEGRPLDPRSDLFSLGVIFYELLNGERPFKGESSPAVMSAILRDRPPSAAELRGDVPEALARVIARCLEKRPENRVQTARDVVNELRHIQKQLESGATRSRPAPATGGVSIAVLPFADLSPNKDQDWFCDGVAEEILNALSPLPGLRVAARASSFSLRGKTDDLRAIGEKLNVKTILEGSVRRAGDRVRITAQLSDVDQGRQLWSERFDRELRDIFDVQEEIARAIVERLKLTLADGDRERIVPKPTANIGAYELLLKGRVLLTRRGPAIIEAMTFFEEAVALDPNLSEAHALLGDAHRLTALYGLRPATQSMPLARRSAERALAIDPNQVEALATLANIYSTYEWDLARATRLSDRALEVDPSHVRARAERAISLVCLNAPPVDLQQRILDDVRRARVLDPLSAWVLSVESMCLACVGRLPEAVAAAERAIALDENNFTARWTLIVALAWSRLDDEAMRAAAPALAMSGRHPRILAEIAGIHHAHGETRAAESIDVELRERAKTGHIGFAERAAVAASAGHLEDARWFVAEALAERDPFLRFWKFPAWRAVWSDSQCAARLRSTPLFEAPPGSASGSDVKVAGV